MSSVSVTYGLRTIKLKTTPSTPLNELLERSISHFKLDATDSYALLHQTTQLSNLPLRLLNLPQGAKLTLKQVSSKPILIQIKVNILNNPQNEISSIVKKLLNSSTLKELIEELEKDLNFSIIGTSYKVKLQNMSGALENSDSSFTNFQANTLKSFGLENSSLLRMTFVKQTVIENSSQQRPNQDISTPEAKKHKQESTSTPAEPTTKTVADVSKQDSTTNPIVKQHTDDTIKPSAQPHGDQQTSDTIIEETYQKNSNPEEPISKPESDVEMLDGPDKEKDELDIKVFKAGESQTQALETSDSVYDLSIPQLKNYQELLSKKAHESPRQAEQRKAKIQKQKLQNLKMINVRIKFPDLIFVDFNISSSKTQEELYLYVTETFLKKQDMEFELYMPHPFTLIPKTTNPLIKNFELRNLLLFQSEFKTKDIIKSEYLKEAKDISETLSEDSERWNSSEEVKEDIISNKSKLSSGEEMKKSNVQYDPSNSILKSKESKLKNLLRLSKK